MNVKQIYELVNTVTTETLGESGLITEDLRNLVDVGKAIFDADEVDNYVKNLVNHIGKVIFVNRPYMGSVPSVLRDSWEYGSVLEKISFDLPEASENEVWELNDGESYDQQIFYKPTATVKFFNKKTTFEIDCSITRTQVKESFSNATQLDGFIAGLHTAIDNSMTVKLDGLVMRTINSLIGETIASDFPDPTSTTPYGEGTGVKAVNLLFEYNERHPSNTLTVDTCISSPDFHRFACVKMGIDIERLQKMSTLFNVEGKARFTPKDRLSIVMLADFKKNSEVYLQSSTYWKELVELPNGVETVPYWQGSSTDYAFENVSKIDIKTPTNKDVSISGVLAVCFDKDACMVCSEERTVDTIYNGKGRFWNNYYHFDCRYFNDLSENCIVYFVADSD